MALLITGVALCASAAPWGPLTASSSQPEPSSERQLLVFTAPWSAACQTLNPILARLQRQGYAVRTVAVDEQRELAARHRVTAVPTCICLRDDQESGRVIGVATEAQLKRLFAQVSLKPATTAAADQAKPTDNVLLDFTARWCGPCQQMSPIITRLQQQGFPIRKVDIDKERALAEQYDVTALPTLVVVANGREVARRTGFTEETQLRQLLAQIPAQQPPSSHSLPRRSDPQPRTVDLGVAESFSTPPGVDLGPPASPDRPPAAAPPAVPAAPPANTAQTPGFKALGQSPDDDRRAANLPPSLDPMNGSTRLRVKDASGVNFGSGTIIDSRIGRTLILTCGHIFRSAGDTAVVEVDVFERNRKPTTYVGKVVQYDLTADVGLIAISTTHVLPTVALASIDKPVAVEDRVVSIGCGGGELPSRESLQVTALNKYDGPDNIECTGLPVQGRSGGGLFRGSEIVGVCIAADPKERRGLYAGLKPIYELIEKAGYGQLLPVGRPAAAPEIVAQAPATSAAPPTAAPAAPATLAAPKSPEEIDALFSQAVAASGVATAAPPTEIMRDALAATPDAEVICIVRPKQPSIPSRVVIIHQASPKLVGYLLDGSQPATVTAPPRNSAALVRTSAVDRAEPDAPSPFGARAERPSAPSSAAPRRPTSPRSY